MEINKKFDIEKYKLDNGLNVILYNNPDTKLVCTNVIYKVGSSYDPQDATGLAHLVEHLMFEGSKNLEKGEHFKVIENLGGQLNAFTTFDYSSYYQNISADYLELLLYLESERMFNIVDGIDETKLQNQKEVIVNERYQRIDNQPYGLVSQLINEFTFGKGHPYYAPIIGYEEHIKNYNIEQVKEFFNTYYVPHNASLMVAGNFDKSYAKELISKYFNSNSNYVPISRKQVESSNFNERITHTHYDNIKIPAGTIIFKTCNFYNDDTETLSFFSELLTEFASSYLNKKYFFENKSVLGISSMNKSLLHDGYFSINFFPAPGFDIDELKEQILSDIFTFKNTPIDEFEFQKVKNSVLTAFIYGLQYVSSLAQKMNYFDVFFNNPEFFKERFEITKKINIDDIKNIIEKYFENKNYFYLKVLPKN